MVEAERGPPVECLGTQASAIRTPFHSMESIHRLGLHGVQHRDVEQAPAALSAAAHSITAGVYPVSDWRDRILHSFTPGITRLTLAADPDGFLLEATLQEALHRQGFEIITFDDRAAFRFDYESRFRSRWDRGEGAGPKSSCGPNVRICRRCPTTCCKAAGICPSAWVTCSPTSAIRSLPHSTEAISTQSTVLGNGIIRAGSASMRPRTSCCDTSSISCPNSLGGRPICSVSCCGGIIAGNGRKVLAAIRHQEPAPQKK